MNAMTVKLAEIVDDLAEDGDCHNLDDGRTLRLRIQPDEDYNPFEESDHYGQIVHTEDRSLRNRDTGRYERPANFDGNAEKLQGGRSDAYWWQPPAWAHQRGTDAFTNLRRQVLDLLERGCYVVTVEVLCGTDAYGRPIVVDVASLSGIDSLDDGYLAEVVGNLISDLNLWQEAA
jgi:hypothetical protein